MCKKRFLLFIASFAAISASALSLSMDTSRGVSTGVLDNIDISGYVSGDKKVSKSSQSASANFLQALKNGDCKEMARIWLNDDQNDIGVLLAACCVEPRSLSGLGKAIRGGNLAEIRKIINVNSVYGYYKKTPLCWACSNMSGVQMFFSYSTRETINKADTNGCTPLWHACYHQSLKVVKFLLPHCTLETINRKVKQICETPLCAVFSDVSRDIKSHEIVRLLLESGANIDPKVVRRIDDGPEELKNRINLAIGYDRAQNKIQFLEAQKKDDHSWLIKRHFALSKSQTLFSDISKDNKYKKLKDCTVITEF